jgi:NAD-dependent SIR2 family protein deacetylase
LDPPLPRYKIIYHRLYRSINSTDERRAGVAIEMTGGLIVNERGTVVTFRQRCEECHYVFEWNKTTIVPAFSSRKVRPFTCPECGNYQEVVARHYDPNRQ